MTKDIVGKLIVHLSKPVDTECSVVYLMAEVRKLLERDDPKNERWGALRMYCHWALHVELYGAGTTLEFLKFVDQWVMNKVHGVWLMRGPWKFQQELILFRDFLYLDTLRTQLKRFLEGFLSQDGQKIPTTMCDEDSWWFAFLGAYAGVIEDGSLSVKTPDAIKELGAVKEITFTKGDSLSGRNHVNFVIKWVIELKDGRIIDLSVDAEPGTGMSGHHLTIRPGTGIQAPTQSPLAIS
jgi:hypothetical protein